MSEESDKTISISVTLEELKWIVDSLNDEIDSYTRSDVLYSLAERLDGVLRDASS